MIYVLNIHSYPFGSGDRRGVLPLRGLCCDSSRDFCWPRLLSQRPPGFSQVQLPTPKGRLVLVTETDSDVTESGAHPVAQSRLFMADCRFLQKSPHSRPQEALFRGEFLCQCVPARPLWRRREVVWLAHSPVILTPLDCT